MKGGTTPLVPKKKLDSALKANGTRRHVGGYHDCAGFDAPETVLRGVVEVRAAGGVPRCPESVANNYPTMGHFDFEVHYLRPDSPVNFGAL